jgi:radical SAM superfamily enzyme YgiQ (UPF0313 family)
MNYNVCVINPPNINNRIIHDYAGGLGFESNSGYSLPSIDLLQIATCISQNACLSVKYIDCIVESLNLDNVITHFEITKYDYVIIQFSIPTLHNDIQFARSIALYCKNIIARIKTENIDILSSILSHSEIQYCLVNECEDNIINILLNNERLGTSYYKDGKVILENKPFIQDLNFLPNLNRKLIKNELYVYPKLGNCATIQTSRGCPYPCGYYCPYPLTQGKKVRYRSVNLVISEIKEIINLGINKILFRDAIFTINQKRIIELCTQIISEGLCVQWWCETRADCLDTELLELMAKAGCVGINIGVESGDPKLRYSLLKPGVSDEMLKNICDVSSELGIKIAFLLMVGFPGETRNSILQTAKLLLSCKPYSIGINYPVNHPGTQFDQDAKSNDWLIIDDYSQTDGSKPVLHGDYLKFDEMIYAKYLLEDIFNAIFSNASQSILDSKIINISQWASQI